MNCKEAKILLTPGLDNELPTADSALLADHIGQCNSCRIEWNAALKLRAGIKSIGESISVRESLEDETIRSLRPANGARAGASGNKRLSLIAVAAIFLLLVFVGTSSLIPIPVSTVSVEAMVHNTAHGAASDQSDFRIAHLPDDSIAQINLKTKSAFVASELGDFRFASADMVIAKNGQRMLRVCYTSDSHEDVCIDCYQSKTGVLSLDGESVSLASGKTAKVASIGGQQIIMFAKNGMDMVYVSRLPKRELLELVAKNV